MSLVVVSTVQASPVIDAEVYFRLANQQAAVASQNLSEMTAATQTSTADEASIPVIIYLSTPVKLQTTTTAEERSRMIRSLQTIAEQTQSSTLTELANVQKQTTQSFWLNNSISAKINEEVLLQLAENNDISKIIYNARIQRDAVAQSDEISTITTDQVSSAYDTQVSQLGTEYLHQLGYYGDGITVAILDSGTNFNHPAISGSWRGEADDWFNPHASLCEAGTFEDTFGETCGTCDASADTPCDEDGGHGTAVASRIVGQQSNGTIIGTAPNAKLIVAKLFNSSGTVLVSQILEVLQWVLDPDGDPDTDDAPDIINCSWGLTAYGEYISTYVTEFQALQDAGTVVVTSAGNYGSESSTDVSPANYSETLSVGSYGTETEEYSDVSTFSSRGPSSNDGSIFPDLLGPGYSVTVAYSEDTTEYYQSGSGTSFSAPAISGAIALLLEADSTLTPTEVFSQLRDTAIDIQAVGADNQAGYGNLQIARAYLALNDETDISVTSEFGDVSYETGPLTAIDFGEYTAGETVDVSFQITNTLSSSIQINTDYTLSSDEDFEILNEDCSGTTLASQDSCSVWLQLTTVATQGEYDTVLTFTLESAPLTELQLSLAATLDTAVAELSLTDDLGTSTDQFLEFEAIEYGETETATITLTNSGTADFEVYTINLADDDIGTDQIILNDSACESQTLEVDESCEIFVSVTKNESGTVASSIEITTAIEDRTVSLSAFANSAPDAATLLTSTERFDIEQGTNLILEWEAETLDADGHDVTSYAEISTTSDFETLVIPTYVQWFYSPMSCVIYAGFGFFWLPKKRVVSRKEQYLRLVLFGIVLISVSFMSGCGGSSSSSSSTTTTADTATVSQTVTIDTSSLETTTYYWRVITEDIYGATTSSELGSFQLIDETEN
jgi:bacillopeptidase F